MINYIKRKLSCIPSEKVEEKTEIPIRSPWIEVCDKASALNDKMNKESDGNYWFHIWPSYRTDHYSTVSVACTQWPIYRPAVLLDINDLQDRISKNNKQILIINDAIVMHSDPDKNLKDIELACRRYIELTKDIKPSVEYHAIIAELKNIYPLWEMKVND